MKNKVRIFNLIFCVILTFNISNAQLIDNKINIYTEGLIGMFHGNDLVHDKDFIYPSLYANLKDINGISIKTLIKKNQFASWGVGATLFKASNWVYINHTDYQGSKLNMISISPIIQFHNKFRESGIFNRVKAFVEVAPTIGMSSLSSSKPLFNIIQNLNDTIISPTESNDMYFGLKGNVGIEWSFSQSTGLLISYSLQHNWITSKLYCDSYFTSSQLNIGVFFKFEKDKRFLYKY